MTDIPMHAAPTGEPARRTIHLSSYVPLGLDQVVELLSSRPANELLLERVIEAVLGDVGRDLVLAVGDVVPVSGASASLSVSWSAPEGDERLVPGHAAVSILVVQSGRDPLTELLLTIDVPELHDRGVASALHAILDGITAELATHARTRVSQ